MKYEPEKAEVGGYLSSGPPAIISTPAGEKWGGIKEEPSGGDEDGDDTIREEKMARISKKMFRNKEF